MATAYFMQLVVDMTKADKDQEHIEMLIHSRPQTPDRTSYIIGESKESPLEDLLAMEEALLSQGCEVIAIPCITAHYFQKDLEANAKGAYVISAIEDTAKYLADRGITAAGLMATDGTVRSKLFQETFKSNGIELIIPDEENQRNVMHLIYEDVKKGKALEMDKFTCVNNYLINKGAQVVLLGCTELSMIKRDAETGPDVLDVMEVLAREAVLACGQLKEEYAELITR